MNGIQSRCVVCRSAIARPVGSVCHDPRCRVETMSRPGVPDCEMCRVRLTPAERFRGICAEPACHRALASKQQETQRQADLQAAQELVEVARTAFVARKAAAGMTVSPDDALWAVVPANDLPVVERTDSRRDRLRAHLASIVGDAEHVAIPPPGAEDEAGTVHDRSLDVCASCLGGCCTQGDNHAYLKPETLARAAQRLGVSLPDLVAQYVARVPERGYESSCIFHGPQGCGLTRVMRSDTCNEHLCGGLRRLRGRMTGRTDDTILVIGMSKSRHVRTDEIG